MARPLDILMVTWGSMGDVQPYVALGRALNAAGHRAVLATAGRFEPLAARAGVQFAAVGDDLTDAVLEDVFARFLGTGSLLRQTHLLIGDLMLRGAERQFADVRALCKGFDVAICHPTAVFAQEAIIRQGIPWVGVVLAPMMLPTGAAPPMGAPNFGPAINRLMWKLAEFAQNAVYARRYRRRIRSLGGQRVHFTLYDALSPRCNLVGVSPALVPPYADVPDSFHWTGRWVLDEPDFTLPPPLVEFLAHEDRPVVVSFGSMAVGRAEGLGAVVTEALAMVGCRSVVQRGWAGLGGDTGGGRVLFVDYIPHELLFPHAACVVIHGGAGATHAAARAGVPAVVVPHLMDQGYWAGVLQGHGAAPPPLPYQKLTARRLAQRISECLDSRPMAVAAARLGAQMKAEDGCAEAVRVIEEFA
ncbi:MAG: glycosyltransferase [Planctomycetaceae bacterium]|nr:glycosyltransferase [Planctomycetaceae bacterium]